MELTEEWLNNFFSKINSENILQRRESISIEFKECFDWSSKDFKSKIAKTAAAFSNTKGGIIFFGIEDKPHKIKGISDWDKIDNEQITTFFNNHFSPHIEYDRSEYIINGNKIGIIYIYETTVKPIVCIRDSAQTYDSDIYYRYNAKSVKIKSGDLQYIISEIRDCEQEKWFNIISRISKIGVNNIGLLDSQTGILTSKNENQYLLDESIINKINFIDKYSINEEGAPALKIIGEIRDSAHIVEKITSIYEEDIYEAFLGIRKIASGIEYLEAIMRQNTEYYPIYSFIKDEENKYSRIEIIEKLKAIKVRSQIKDKIINRIYDDNNLIKKHKMYPLSSPKRGPGRKKYYDKIISLENIEINSEEHCKDFFEAIFNLEKNSYSYKNLIEIYITIYKEKYPFNENSINYLFRWSLCYLDNLENKDT